MKIAKFKVGKKFEISYAHYLQDYEGKCSEVHGHNAIIELVFSTIEKPFQCVPTPIVDMKFSTQERVVHNQSSGMIIDFSQIKEEVEKEIKQRIDHKNLNDFDFFKHCRPTAENICCFILRCIPIKYIRCIEIVRVWEDRDSFAEITMNNRQE